MDDIQKTLKAILKGQSELSNTTKGLLKGQSELFDTTKALMNGQSELSNITKGLLKGQSELSNTTKGLLKGQSELSDKIDNVKLELSINIDDVHREVQDSRTETRNEFIKVNDRIDRIGKSLAYLEDDTPTREEFDILEANVAKIKHTIVVA